MRKLFTLCLLLAITFIALSFKVNQRNNVNSHYIFITAIELDTKYDEPGNNGYVDITTNIVSYNCTKSDETVKHQFIEFYNAEIASNTKSLAFDNTTTAVWSYSTFDEALASRREWLANKAKSKYKRSVNNFYVICN